MFQLEDLESRLTSVELRWLYNLYAGEERIGPQTMAVMQVHVEDYENSQVSVVGCPRFPSRVYLKNRDIDRFYIRIGPPTTELPGSQTQDRIK